MTRKNVVPQLDIIIPAYKCSHTIRRTLQSLDMQMDPDFNLILVLDGEDTELAAAAMACAPACSSFKIITRPENGGPGACRNTGIDESHAPYLMFLDADDILLPHAVSTTYRGIEQGFDYMIGKTMRQAQNGNFDVVGSEQLTWLHGRVYNREFLTLNKIRFPELPMSEDLAFNMLCAEYAKTVPETAWPIHIQQWRGDSISHRQGAEKLQAKTYIQACLYYAQKINPSSALLLPNAVANCYYYLDCVERMFPEDKDLYGRMCKDFISLSEIIDLPELLCRGWENRLSAALASPGRPFGKLYIPEMTFTQRLIDAEHKAEE